MDEQPMGRIEALLYDLRHPITYVQRQMANRYCQRFGLRIVGPPFVTLWDKDMNRLGALVKDDA